MPDLHASILHMCALMCIHRKKMKLECVFRNMMKIEYSKNTKHSLNTECLNIMFQFTWLKKCKLGKENRFIDRKIEYCRL